MAEGIPDYDKRHTNASVLDYYAYIAETGEASSSSSPSSNYSTGGTFNDKDNYSGDSHRQTSVLERMDSNSYTHLNVYAAAGAEGPVKVGSYDYKPGLANPGDGEGLESAGSHTVPPDVE